MEVYGSRSRVNHSTRKMSKQPKQINSPIILSVQIQINCFENLNIIKLLEITRLLECMKNRDHHQM